jgi:GMP synthase-like glutamine amidotransferase
MILVVDMNWKKASLGYYEFVEPLAVVAKELDAVTVKHYNEVSDKDIDNCDRIVMSGTTLKDIAVLAEPEKVTWLKETYKPVLGICAGMEAIGVVFDLRLIRCLEIGMTQISTLKENPLFSASFKAYSLHNYAVNPSSDFEILAESAQCVQAIKHKQKPIYGVLFHPEVRNIDILKRFIALKK